MTVVLDVVIGMLIKSSKIVSTMGKFLSMNNSIGCTGFIAYIFHALDSCFNLLFKFKTQYCCYFLFICLAVMPNASYALEKVSLQLKYLHQFQFAGYYAALQQGYYSDIGLEVSIIEGSTGKEPQTKVLSGEVQFGVGSSSLLLARNAGDPFVVLGVIFQHSPYTLLMPFNEATQGIHHIAGKRVMMAAQSEELIAYLNKENIPVDKLIKIPHSFDPNDLIQGKVDAFSAYLTNETDYLDQVGFRYQAFSPRSAGIDFYGDNLFTSEQEIENHPERVEAFRKASMKGWQYAFKNPDRIIDLILTKYSQRNTREHLQYEARQMIPLVQPVLVELGYMNPGRWQHIVTTYAELGMLPSDYKFEGFLYNTKSSINMIVWYFALGLLLAMMLVISVVHFRSRALERKQAKEQIEFKNTLLSTQQEASLDGLLAVDDHQNIISANQRYLDMWGVDKVIIDRGDDISLMETVARKLVNPEHFYQRIDEIRKQRNLTCTEEIKLTDGRVFERDSSPLVTQDGQYFGRLWSFRDITQRKEADQLIWNQANLDFLTGLPNRYLLNSQLETQLRIAERSNLKVALLFLDLDRFKEINDTLGHYVGDRLLQETAQRLKNCIRETDTIARLGGDEFTVVLGSVTDRHIIERVANDILQALSSPFEISGNTTYVSSSIGITIFPDDGDDVETLLKNADQAMYAAKDNGRNDFQYFTATMQENADARLHLVNDLRVALSENQFQLFYQPIVELKTGKIIKAEALIRWFHPERDLVSPVEFIHVAEETGMIVDIGNWVFKQATMQLSEWRDRHQIDLKVSINVSPIQFCNKGGLDRWVVHLSKLQLTGAALIVEITEGILMEVNDQVSQQLLDFCDEGINIALDDFGTGYSSLAYLNRFDIDYLKIDKAFVQNLKPDSNDLALCEAIVVMAHKLGIKVIAEGVETKEQLQLLTEAGCDSAQGYFISRPVPADQFELLLIDSIGENSKKQFK